MDGQGDKQDGKWTGTGLGLGLVRKFIKLGLGAEFFLLSFLAGCGTETAFLLPFRLFFFFFCFYFFFPFDYFPLSDEFAAEHSARSKGLRLGFFIIIILPGLGWDGFGSDWGWD